jgi:hypothetical protein
MKTLRHTLKITALLAGAVALALTAPAAADQVINDDCIVIGSQCIGQDCVNGEAFGFDTLRLKENNLRIHFDDTSNSASFPRNDWRIVANDTANGGASYLGIEDSTAGRQPFRITAGAPSNSLFVASSGRVGLRTSTPTVELHVVDGDSPTLRLEQDGSSGFMPQVWDLAGNETNFFIRDVTNGSKLPFRIKPGAPTNSIYVGTDGVGLGTTSPSAKLHVVGSNGAAPDLRVVGDDSVVMRLERPGADVVGFQMGNGAVACGAGGASACSWNNTVLVSGNYAISDAGDGAEFTLTPAGNLTLAGTLTITGGCTGCDAVFTDDFELESIEEHAASMWQKGYLPAVGKTDEGKVSIDVFQKTTGILQELEKAHIYIDQLNQDLKARDARLAELNERLARLEAAAIN